jgi:UDP-N-acetylmuramoyl-L-alanyl-D-glutamate--2,6-diaminopimelate ligase
VPIAEIALANADLCILTSNNPTNEDPHQIIREMVTGLPIDELVRGGRLEMIVDRREAIFRAVEAAQPAGLVMVLGRGAQPTQAIGACDIPFDDREVARAAMAACCTQ